MKNAIISSLVLLALLSFLQYTNTANASGLKGFKMGSYTSTFHFYSRKH